MLPKQDTPLLIVGICSTFAGIGLSRFAYTPLLPELIRQSWFDAHDAVYLGAANLLGYLLGALSAHWLSERIAVRRVLGFSLLIIALSYLLCASQGRFEWFFLWRLLAGIAGAILVVVGPSLALTLSQPHARSRIGALSFTGIGLGALLSAVVVPLLMNISLAATWLTLGGLGLLAAILCDRAIAMAGSAPAATHAGNTPQQHRSGTRLVILLVITAYALDALGFVPHTVFWVDFLAREASLGTQSASLQWAVFGTGALIGPLLAGLVARRVGLHNALILAFLINTCAIALPLLSLHFISRTLSSFLVGVMVPAIVALTSGRLAELTGPTEHKRFWGLATAAFAAAQAASGYGMSALYEALQTYYPLFAIGAGLLGTGLLLLLLGKRVLPEPEPTTKQ